MAKAICTANSGTVKLSPGLTNTAAKQTVKIQGTLTGCTGLAFTEVSYKATLTTAAAVSCSVLTGAGEPATGPAKYKWTPKPKPATSTGPLSLMLSETPSVAFSGEVTAGPFSPLKFSGAASETYEGGPKCGVPNGKKAARSGQERHLHRHHGRLRIGPRRTIRTMVARALAARATGSPALTITAAAASVPGPPRARV